MILLGSMVPGNQIVSIRAVRVRNMESLIVNMYFLPRGSFASSQNKSDYQLEVNLGRIKYCDGTKQGKRRVQISLSVF